MIRAYAPASIGNFAAGFDILGVALAPVDGTLLGDVVELTGSHEPGFRAVGAYADTLAPDRENLVVHAMRLHAAAVAAKGGEMPPLAAVLHKELPLCSGLGSSSSSIVAALVALEAMSVVKLGSTALLDLAGQAEGIYSGAVHLDNVAPALLGGLRLLVPELPVKPGARRPGLARELEWPHELLLVVVHPDYQLSTAASRAALPREIPVHGAVAFAQNLAAFVHAIDTGDRTLLAATLRDPLAEAHRAPLVPGFFDVKAAALAAGALGCSLSGSGPSVFAVVDEDLADGVRDAMIAGFERHGLAARAWICAPDLTGARILA